LLRAGSRSLRFLGFGFLIAGVGNFVLVLAGQSSGPTLSASIGGLLIAIGAALLWWRSPSWPAEPPIKESHEPALPTIGIERKDAVYSLVLVVSEDAMKSAMRAPIERQMLRTIAAQPHFSLTPNARIETASVPRLPGENKAAVEGLVWALQSKFGKRGGQWQADFYDRLGFSFMVLYLE